MLIGRGNAAFRRLLPVFVASAAWCSGIPAQAISFNFLCVADPACASFDTNALNGFEQAADLWTQRFSDPITVKIEIGFQPLGAGILGQANGALNNAPYSFYKFLLGQDRTSSADDLAFGSLPAGSNFPLLINRTADNPNGSGSATPYVDNDGGANNNSITLSTANVKVLGETPAYDSQTNSEFFDGWITFNNSFNWDFDRSDGILSGFFDFVGVAAHEIGHVLGFLSGVDVLDDNSSNPYFNDDQFNFVQPLDLYRYSELSVVSDMIDWTADQRDKFFSIDGGANPLALFSTGVIHGDGRQASHWKDNQSLGLMDPTFAPGELGVITDLDVLAFDVIGYDRRDLTDQQQSESVPAPLPLAGAACAYGWARRLRRRVAAAG